MTLRIWAVLVVLVLAAGCRMSPAYKRPPVPTPPAFRGAGHTNGDGGTASLADTKWFDLFQDPQLATLIRRAQGHNFDVREAVTRIEAARANLGISRSYQLPSAGVAVDATALRFSRGGNFPIPAGFSQQRTYGTVALNLLSYEVDIWGRLRDSTDAARADLLAAEENRNAVLMTLVSDVATAYFNLLALDDELDIARRTLLTREDSLQLVELRERRGLATKLELRQAEQLVRGASQAIPRIQQLIEQTENEISLLIGESPGEIARGRRLEEQAQPPAVPAGLPSALLERRPDIRAAEQRLIASNFMIGAAKAEFFPQISLTGFLGSQSSSLSSLFSGPTRMWQFVPQVSQPLYTGGRVKSNVELAGAERQRAVVEYQRAIQTAFREVSDALVLHRKVKEVRAEQEALVATLQDRVRLSYLRYRGGVDPLLSALDADRDLFEAELVLTRTKRDELLAVVQLYRALGGGWQQ